MTAIPGAFRRPVSPTEWLYLAGMSPRTPLVIQVCVEGDGQIERATLGRAVTQASLACPGSRLVRRGRWWADSGQPPAVRVVEPGWSELRGELPGTGPTCEVLLVRDSDPATVVFRAQHAVMDGRGVLRWAQEVFRALRGEQPAAARATDSDFTLLERLGGRPGRIRLAARSPLPCPSGPPGGFLWRRRTVSGTHPALVAKLASVVADFSGLPQARLMVPVDLRRHDPSTADSTANLALPLFLDARPGTPWEELHGQLLDALSADEELAAGPQRLAPHVPLSALHHLLRALEAAGGRLDRHLGTALISHLGRVDPGAFSTAGFTASCVYSLPVQAPFVPVSLIAVECPGRTEITLCGAEGPNAAAGAEELLDRVEDVLSPRQARLGTVARAGGTPPSAAASRGGTLIDLFREQAARTPGAVALVDPAGQSSYAELDRRSDVIARELLNHGAGRGSVVGLFADRRADAVAGLWGIWKCGAAYLPLDPEHPDARTAQLLDDAGARLCLVHSRYADRVAGACKTVVLDTLPPHPPSGPGAPAPDAPVGPDDLAYVIYTSGSTGRPKGVEVEHRSLVTYVDWAIRRYGVHDGTRFALFTSLAFDLTGTSLLLPLVAGGSVALLPGAVDHLTLRHALRDCGATALKLTPAHLDLIGRLGLEPRGFETVVVGGEQLTGPVAADAQRLFGPGCHIFNEYGPTEATIGCIVHRFDPEQDGSSPAVPIGLPVDHTGVHLLDADRRPVPPGELGEMYLVGEQLARGYRGDPEAGRERFVRLVDGSRAYRTGDLARLLPSGVLEYAGRADDQIKVLGHRVEPAEVARVLEQHPAVTRALVVGRRPPGRAHDALCAYVVTSGPVSDDTLTEHLAGLLPRHLVPAAIVQVPGFAYTVNGKVDVDALPDPFPGEPAAAEPHPAEGWIPEDRDAGDRDEVESQVARVWAEVLGIDAHRVDHSADFYRMGGDSLSLLTLFAAVAARFAGSPESEAHRRIMTELRGVVDRPRFDRVCAGLRRALQAGTPSPEEN